MIKKHRKRYWLSVILIILCCIAAFWGGAIATDFMTDGFVSLFLGLLTLIGFPMLCAYFLMFVWRYELKPIEDDRLIETSSQTIGKQKRQAIDEVLQELSDDDLLALRQRLQERSIDDEDLYDHFVGDDGELVYRK